MELDEKSREIILTLLRDGRASFTELAAKMGVSVPSAKNRFESMVEKGLLDVKGLINLNQFNWKIAIVLIKTSTATHAIKHVNSLTRCPRIIFIGTATGTYDLYLIFVGENLSVLKKHIENAISGLEGVELADYLYGDLPSTPTFIPINVPLEKTETPPCGAKCNECLLNVTGKCGGCPSTIGGPSII
ncbi:MAG: winged helix-turn-helix transcriptional regulator [Nitrososphaeria archaeon]|nr:winged helix-turn-helix transcriptional regulator [Nitrososphaeria archaeon]NIQ33254.1 winged helix-turn-helix transcriptional regulator [Nitrososphaeria archaeon]